jgi:hypothetical protein
MAPGQQLVGDAGERKDVVARIRRLVGQHLRAGIGRRQGVQHAGIEDGIVAMIHLRTGDGAGDAEVDDLGPPALRDDDVGRLQIEVDDAVLMRIDEGGADVADDPERLRSRQPLEAGGADDPIERLARQVLHGHVEGGAVAVEVVHGDDVGVRQGLRLLGLALQRAERFRVAAEVLVQHLEGDEGVAVLRLLLAQVERLEHGAHAALAQPLRQDEAAVEHLSGLEPRRRADRLAQRLLNRADGRGDEHGLVRPCVVRDRVDGRQGKSGDRPFAHLDAGDCCWNDSRVPTQATRPGLTIF